jgi:hypothetical protein
VIEKYGLYVYIYVYIWLPYYSIIDGLLIDNMDIIDNEITVYIYIWVNYNDLTTTSLESWLVS